MPEGIIHREIVSVLVMDGVSFIMEELKVFLEGSDVFYGTFFLTVILDGHSQVVHDSFSLFFFKSVITALF